MDITQVEDYAHRLYAAHGDKAEAEAAQKAAAAKEAGDEKQAEDWNRIRNAIRALRGANAS